VQTKVLRSEQNQVVNNENELHGAVGISVSLNQDLRVSDEH
jgi:hypothetical protein